MELKKKEKSLLSYVQFMMSTAWATTLLGEPIKFNKDIYKPSKKELELLEKYLGYKITK